MTFLSQTSIGLNNIVLIIGFIDKVLLSIKQPWAIEAFPIFFALECWNTPSWIYLLVPPASGDYVFVGDGYISREAFMTDWQLSDLEEWKGGTVKSLESVLLDGGPPQIWMLQQYKAEGIPFFHLIY